MEIKIFKLWILLIVVEGGFTAEYLMKKPEGLLSCKLSDPDFTKCSTKSVQHLFDLLSPPGIEGIENMPDIDPMKINKLRIFQGSGPVNVNASLNKVLVTGFGNVQVLESRVSPKDFSWSTKLLLPKMRLDGIYDLKGRILIIPLRGHGKLFIEATNMIVILKTKTKLYEKFDHVFYNVTTTSVDYEISGLKLQLDNLFDGIKSLEESTNRYLNENWRPAADALKPIVQQTIEGILLDIMQKIFHYIPADYLVVDIPRPSQNKGLREN